MMSVCEVAIKQREEELQKLKVLLICSLTGSLLLHLAVLVSGIADLLKQVAKDDTVSKPIEITFIDIPKEEPKPVEKKPLQKLPKKIELLKIENTSKSPQLPLPSPAKVEEKIPVATPVRTVSNFNKPDIRPLQPLISSSFQKSISQPQKTSQKIFTPEPVNTPVEEIIKKPITEPIAPIKPKSFSTPEPVKTPVEEIIKKPVTEPIAQVTPKSFSTPGINKSNLGDSGDLLAQTPATSSSSQRISRKLIDGGNNPSINNSNINNGGNPLGDSNNSSGINSSPRSLRAKFTGGSSTGNSAITTNIQGSDTGDGRASCVQCGTNYPSWARRQGIEGKIVVAVDTDSSGNIINVELISSSGNSKLDEEHLQIVKGWKLKPSQNGRSGVTIATEYILK